MIAQNKANKMVSPKVGSRMKGRGEGGMSSIR